MKSQKYLGENMTSKLLQPIQVGNLTFKNRIMFPL